MLGYHQPRDPHVHGLPSRRRTMSERSMTDSHGQPGILLTLSSVRSRRHSYHSQADSPDSIPVAAPHFKSVLIRHIGWSAPVSVRSRTLCMHKAPVVTAVGANMAPFCSGASSAYVPTYERKPGRVRGAGITSEPSGLPLLCASYLPV